MIEKPSAHALLRHKTIDLMTDSAIAKKYGISARQIFRLRIKHQIPALAQEDYVARRSESIRKKAAEQKRCSWPKVSARSQAAQDTLFAPHGGKTAYNSRHNIRQRSTCPAPPVCIRPLLVSPCGSSAALCAAEGDPE